MPNIDKRRAVLLVIKSLNKYCCMLFRSISLNRDSLIPAHADVYLMIRFVSDFWQVSGFICIPTLVSPPIKLTAKI